jgi:hypothetical protein
MVNVDCGLIVWPIMIFLIILFYFIFVAQE